jgi:murein DD-endopeptidase MepM/ murein hydrolase activator NlpD
VFVIIGTDAVGSALAPAPNLPVGRVAGAVDPATTPVPETTRTSAAGAVHGALPRAIPDAGAAEPRSAPPISGLIGYRWPLPRGRLTQPFGPARVASRVVDGVPFHDGIDLATFCGDQIVAAHDGIVLAASRHYDDVIGWVGDLGAYYRRLDAKKLWSTLPIVVVIDDGNGYRSMYAHFEKVVVRAGQRIHAGDLLGYEGRTGHATGCHLHYGLFSPYERGEIAIERGVATRMTLPPAEIARIDPLLVLPASRRTAATPTIRPRLNPEP